MNEYHANRHLFACEAPSISIIASYIIIIIITSYNNYTLFINLFLVFMQSIRVSHNDRVDECFVAMLEAWFKKGSPSWSVMVEALRGRGVEGGTLANNIERTFMNTY